MNYLVNNKLSSNIASKWIFLVNLHTLIWDQIFHHCKEASTTSSLESLMTTGRICQISLPRL